MLSKTGLAVLLALPATAFAQQEPLGCFARDYTDAHLAQNPEQVVDWITIIFTDEGDYNSAAVRVLLADQGHAGRAGISGQIAGEVAGTWGEPLRYGIECDGGSFVVTSQDADGITIQTSHFRLALDGCVDEGPTSNLAENSTTRTTYRLFRADPAVCAG